MELKVGQLQLLMRCAHPTAKHRVAEETRIAAAVNVIFDGEFEFTNHNCKMQKCGSLAGLTLTLTAISRHHDLQIISLRSGSFIIFAEVTRYITRGSLSYA